MRNAAQRRTIANTEETAAGGLSAWLTLAERFGGLDPAEDPLFDWPGLLT